MKTLPVRSSLLIRNAENRLIHYSKCLKLSENPTECTSSWITEKGPAFYDGLIQGTYAFIEDILHSHNAYNGFMEVNDIRQYCYK